MSNFNEWSKKTNDQLNDLFSLRCDLWKIFPKVPEGEAKEHLRQAMVILCDDYCQGVERWTIAKTRHYDRERMRLRKQEDYDEMQSM